MFQEQKEARAAEIEEPTAPERVPAVDFGPLTKEIGKLHTAFMARIGTNPSL